MYLSCNVKDPFGTLAFIVYLIIMLLAVWHLAVFSELLQLGSRGQLVPLFVKGKTFSRENILPQIFIWMMSDSSTSIDIPC